MTFKNNRSSNKNNNNNSNNNDLKVEQDVKERNLNLNKQLVR